METDKKNMKKLLPSIFIAIVFTALMVSQMLINGQELSASKLELGSEKTSFLEDKFSKFDAVTSKSEKIDLKKINSPIIILNFWASWCTPCIAEFESLNKLILKFGEKIKVIGINNDTEDALKAISKIENKYGLKFSSIPDEEGKFAEMFNVSRIPSTIVYHKGKVIKFSEKEFDFMNEQFTDMINKKLEN